MGNSQCAPRAHGENVKDFLRRKFGCVSRRRRIDDLVMLAIQGEEHEFKNAAGGIKLTKRELARYYEERDAFVDEFNDDVMEIEMYKFGHETPSEYSDTDDSDYSDTDSSETASYSPELSPEAPVYSDPVNQRLFEEYCRQEWDKELDLISLTDLPELDVYKDTACKRTSYTKQNNGVSMVVNSGASKATTIRARANTQTNAEAKNPKTPVKVAKIASEIGGGERLGTSCKTNALTAHKNDFGENGLEKGKRQHAQAGKIEIGGSSNARSMSENINKPRFLQKITEGLRQRQGTQSRATSKTDKVDGVSEAVSLSFIKATNEHLEKDSDTDVSKEKTVGRKVGFFRRFAAIFQRRGSSPMSPKSVIHVKPAASDTEFMPQ